jgi:hypothetical protein
MNIKDFVKWIKKGMSNNDKPINISLNQLKIQETEPKSFLIID